MSVVAVLALTACGRQSSEADSEHADPASWAVGEEDRTTPAAPVQPASLAVEDFAFDPETLVLTSGQSVRVENTGTETHTVILAGVDVATLGPGASKLVPITLVPGQYAFSLQEDPSVTGTLVVP